MSRITLRTVLAVGGVLLAVCGTAAAAPAVATATAATAQTTSCTTDWMIDAGAVNSMYSSGAATETQLLKWFNKPCTYILDPTGFVAGWSPRDYIPAGHTGDYNGAGGDDTSIDSLLSTSDTNNIPDGAIVYDDEDWSYSPAAQQDNPTGSEHSAKSTVNSWNKAQAQSVILINTPAVDLESSQPQTGSGCTGTGTSNFTRYLDANCPRPADPSTGVLPEGPLSQYAAEYGNGMDIQAQDLELCPASGTCSLYPPGGNAPGGSYESFVQQAAADAAQGNSGAFILAGLSTNPATIGVSGAHTPVSACTMYTDYGAVKSMVSGYWLNVTDGTGQGYGGKTNDQVLASFMSNVTAGTDPCG